MASDDPRQQFIDFLGGKAAAGANCEACGTNDWMVPASGAGFEVDIPMAQPGGNIRMPPPSIPARVIVCKNCGKLRFHALAVIDPAGFKARHGA